MIIEPVGARPDAPRRRLATNFAFVFPFVVLVAVVGFGVLGRGGDAATPANRGPAVTPPSAVRSIDGAPGQPAEYATRAAETARFPSSLFGLPVRNTAETLRLRRARRSAGVVAVSGYLSLSGERASCSDSVVPPGRLGSFCHRVGILVDSPQSPFNPTRGIPAWWLGPHLHPQFPVGTRLPEETARTVLAARGAPLPVILVGRFDDPRAVRCPPDGRHCGEELVVDRVGWSDGEVWRRSTAFDPLLDAKIRDRAWKARFGLVGSAFPGNTPILSATLIASQNLPRLEPQAAAAVTRRNPRDALWLVRALVVGAGRRGEPAVGRVVWAIVDASTGEIVARGPAPADRG
ncbi:MAG: hypothetical protein M3301_06635 [Chloroflexota bacterium]|nr:hypothetical protein [Chloroflexota bacterium]